MKKALKFLASAFADVRQTFRETRLSDWLPHRHG
jgi:hypothetical protein